MTSTTTLRTRWAALGAAVAVTLGAVGVGSINIASAGISSGDRPVFVPVDGCRLMDTRPDFNVGDKSSPFGPDETLTLTAHGANGNCDGANAIPTDAVGLALNVTAVNASVETFLTVWGDGADPGTSNLNPAPGQPPTPNAVNTPLSTTGTFKIRNHVGNVDVLIDIVGYYADHDHDDRYYTQADVDAAITELKADLEAAIVESETMWARVAPDGTIVNSSPGVTGSEFTGTPTGRVLVTFPRDVSMCAYSVTAESNMGAFAIATVNGADLSSGDVNTVYILAELDDNPTDTEISIAVNC